MNVTLSHNLLRIRQQHPIWCIPASIEIALKYSKLDFNVTQQELWGLLNGDEPSFLTYKKALEKDSKFDKFSFETWGPGEPKDLKQKIERALNDNFPVLISTPAILPASGWHIRVCHTLKGDELIMYDPGDGQDKKQTMGKIDAETKERGGGDILIIGLKSVAEKNNG